MKNKPDKQEHLEKKHFDFEPTRKQASWQKKNEPEGFNRSVIKGKQSRGRG